MQAIRRPGNPLHETLPTRDQGVASVGRIPRLHCVIIARRGDAQATGRPCYPSHFIRMAAIGEESCSSDESYLAEPIGEPRNPYKGLRAFTGDDATDFFGRDTVAKKYV